MARLFLLGREADGFPRHCRPMLLPIQKVQKVEPFPLTFLWEVIKIDTVWCTLAQYGSGLQRFMITGV